jgi:histone H3/H4
MLNFFIITFKTIIINHNRILIFITTIFSATLTKFIKQVATSNHIRVDGKLVDLIDKLTIRYITYLSQISSDICNESGKKTLNINHILEALKKLGLESHIKLLQAELKLDVSQEALELGQNEVDEMKDRINQKKKKRKDKKKNDIEFNEELKNEQMKLFEMSRIEAYNLMHQEGQYNNDNNVNYEPNKILLEDSFINGNNDVIEEENYDY